MHRHEERQQSNESRTSNLQQRRDIEHVHQSVQLQRLERMGV
jgi:hypothetical protein